MIRIFEFDALKPEEILNRDIRAEASVEATVDAIIADVRARGDAALKDYALKFDHAQLDELRVSQAEIDEAFEAAGEDFVTTLKMAAANIRAFHEHQVHKNFVMNDTPGIVLGQKYTPIEKAGVYVPGGTAAYPSTVLMDVIPAKVAGVKEASVEATVDAIIADVRARGDAALKDYALKFDHAQLDELRVSQAEIDEAFEAAGEDFVTTLKMAAANIRAFHEHQVHKNFVMNDTPGIVLGQKYTPIEKAGVYVPGGTAAYPSTVLMDVIPAKVAGVKEIVMTTPAGPDGKVNPSILAAAVIAGIDKIFKTGGAQAVAALAYGTESIPAVDKIVGPGNIYVATAKRKVFGKVGIDMIAGPSEILVLADGSCNPAWVAADLLSQAEHDKLASPVLVTDSAELAKAVQAELEVQIPQLPRAAIARASVDTNGKIIVTDDMNKAIDAVNIIAPEHLEICVDDPFAVLNSVKNAGSIFLGKNVPEALGDYFAGPNHTLPTSGTARFSSPLGVDDFVKKSSFIYYTRDALGKVQSRIADFAEHEGLHAHAKSVTIRFEDQ